MAFYFSSVTKALYDTDVFPVASLPANKVEITETVYTELLTKQNQGYVILADGSGNPYTVNQSEASATDIKHAASVATTLALGHVKIGNTMTAANDGTLDVKDDAITAAKVKDNETLPVNVSGSATSAQRAETIFEGSSNAVGKIVRSIGTLNTNAMYGGWKKFITLSASSIGNYTGCRICGYIYAKDSNWGQAPTYKIRFQIIINFTSNSYKIYHTPSSNVSSLIRIVEVSPRSNYEIQIKPQGLGVHSFFYVYAWEDHRQNDVSSSWNTDMAVSGSTGTVVSDQYVLDTYAFAVANGQVGAPSTPVYVDSNGQVKPCDASPFIINKMVKEDGTDLDFSTLISFDVGYGEGFKTIGKLNISPSNKNCIIDITFISRVFEELDENDNSQEGPAATFAVFVGNTEISSFYLQGSRPHNDPNYTPYLSSPSFRCTFSANINNTIYIKVKKSGYYSRKLKIYDIKIQGLAFYKD